MGQTPTRRTAPASFIAQLLAPLPADTEQTDGKAFLRQIKADAKEVWRRGMRHVHSSNHWRDHHHLEWLIAKDEGRDGVGEDLCWQAAQQEHWRTCDRQMRIPAPSITALRWKQASRKYLGGHAEWEAAIAADEARLEGRARA